MYESACGESVPFFIQKLIKDGNVLVNGTPVKGSCRVKCDDEVVFSVPESVEPDIEPRTSSGYPV